MSKYIPYKAQIKEQAMQEVRRSYGLKTGFYVKYPDPEKGPYIVKASSAEKLKEAAAEIKLSEEK